jgi:hypothetical protein
MSAPTLINPDYYKDFYIFSFASNDTTAAVLLHRNDQGHEQLVAFFNNTLRDAEVKYDPIEKQAYALIKSLKAFRIYILHAKVIAYVPSSSVRDVLIQLDIDGKRAKWIDKLIEFDIDIKPTKLIKGRGLESFLLRRIEMRVDMLEVELNTLDPKSFDNIHDFFSKFKYLILILEYCGIVKSKQEDQLILTILAKLGLEYVFYVSTFHFGRYLLGSKWNMTTMEKFIDSLTQKQEKLIQMGLIKEPKAHALPMQDEKGSSNKNPNIKKRRNKKKRRDIPNP